MKVGRLPRGLGGGCRARVIELLASAPPMPVASMARALRLSYMGVKSQCIKLERSGYLASSLHRRERGRPEVHYRLTPKGRGLFPQGGSAVSLALLDHSARLFGSQAPQKILFAYFVEVGERYAEALRGKRGEERAVALAGLRSSEGHFARFEGEPSPRLIEGHHPLERLFDKFPDARAFEVAALGKALGATMHRSEGPAGEAVFAISWGGGEAGGPPALPEKPGHPAPSEEPFRLVGG